MHCKLHQAQISPVRLSVNKNQKTTQTTISQSDLSINEQEVDQEVSYTIVVTSTSGAPVSDIKIKWAIMVKPTHGKTDLKLVEGERTCSLNFGQKFTFDTDLMQLNGKKWQSRNGRNRKAISSQIVGYAVEVYIGDRVVASDIQPPDAKRKIDLLRGGGEGGQQLHQF